MVIIFNKARLPPFLKKNKNKNVRCIDLLPTLLQPLIYNKFGIPKFDNIGAGLII